MNHFQFSRGVHKGQVNKDNEFSVSLLLVGCFDELRFILTDNLVLVNELIKQSGLCNEVLKVTLRALAFFQWTRVDARNETKSSFNASHRSNSTVLFGTYLLDIS